MRRRARLHSPALTVAPQGFAKTQVTERLLAQLTIIWTLSEKAQLANDSGFAIVRRDMKFSAVRRSSVVSILRITHPCAAFTFPS